MTHGANWLTRNKACIAIVRNDLVSKKAVAGKCNFQSNHFRMLFVYLGSVCSNVTSIMEYFQKFESNYDIIANLISISYVCF